MPVPTYSVEKHNSYSQDGTDTLVAKIFDFEVPYEGSLLEIGAWMPDDFSNSRLLIEKGWRAVLIDLSPLPLDRLVRCYADNPKVKVISAAVTPCDQHIKEFQITEDALSSSAPGTLERWKGLRQDYDGGFYGSLWVPTLTVQKLFDQFYGDHTPDFVSIDTEGDSFEVMMEMLNMDRRPKVISVEHDGRIVEIAQSVEPLGYVAVKHSQQNMLLHLV